MIQADASRLMVSAMYTRGAAWDRGSNIGKSPDAACHSDSQRPAYIPAEKENRRLATAEINYVGRHRRAQPPGIRDEQSRHARRHREGRDRTQRNAIERDDGLVADLKLFGEAEAAIQGSKR
jgi:hypothetical protein